MYKEITNEDITDGKIYLHAVTFLADVLYRVVIDDYLFELSTKEKNFTGKVLFQNICEYYVNLYAYRLKLSQYLCTGEQEEYIKRFVRVSLGFIFGDKDMVDEMISDREKYKKSYEAVGDFILEYTLPLIREFDKLWTNDYGKIREDTPLLRN